MLTIAQICRLTEMDRSALNRYLAETDVRRMLGGEETHPEYPETSREMFCQLAQLHTAKLVTPKTFCAVVRAKMGDVRISDTSDRNSDSLMRNSDTSQALTPRSEKTAELERVVEQTIERVIARTVPAPPDRFLRTQAAAELLQCHPTRVRQFVSSVPGRRGIYIESEIFEYIRQQKERLTRRHTS